MEINEAPISYASPPTLPDEIQSLLDSEWPDDFYDVPLVVSGLPRSGTSLMMQILQAAGVPLVTDGLRERDDHNRFGYFEVEDVKDPANYSEALFLRPSAATKIVAPLLRHLPTEKKVCVIFMLRNLDDVARSQERMLADTAGEVAAHVEPAFLQTQLLAACESLAARKIPVCFVSFEQLLQNPCKAVAELAEKLQNLSIRSVAPAVVKGR